MPVFEFSQFRRLNIGEYCSAIYLAGVFQDGSYDSGKTVLKTSVLAFDFFTILSM